MQWYANTMASCDWREKQVRWWEEEQEAGSSWWEEGQVRISTMSAVLSAHHPSRRCSWKHTWVVLYKRGPTLHLPWLSLKMNTDGGIWGCESGKQRRSGLSRVQAAQKHWSSCSELLSFGRSALLPKLEESVLLACTQTCIFRLEQGGAIISKSTSLFLISMK